MCDEDYIKMFLDWLNNFASLDGFSEHYGMKNNAARIIILKGRNLHHRKLEA